MINPNDPKLKSWIEVKSNCDFPIQNLPFGIFKTKNRSPRLGTAIGEYILDLQACAEKGLFADFKIENSVFAQPQLNNFIALGKEKTKAVRAKIAEILSADNTAIKENKDLHPAILIKQSDAEMLLPVRIGDYTDFYSSIDHATNVGKMFRDPENALLPNWKHLPVGYHGRASSIVVSGTNFHRPKGQNLPPDQLQKPPKEQQPIFGASKLMDFELETAFIIGKQTEMGKSISTAEATDYIFGMVLFNDWSARDIQTWEYVPLGPFLAKNFCSSVSPWVVTIDALKPFRVEGYKQTPEVLPYLKYEGIKNIDINLQVYLQPENCTETKICESNYKFMYWTMEQQLAHHTVNGCNINVGDMMASGTISGPTENSYGSMLELSWRGTKPLKMADGSERKFINDGDTVIIRGYAEKNGVRVGFGEVKGKVLPAL
jgi:fumarylacetoacetase